MADHLFKFFTKLKSSEKTDETTHYVYSGGERVRKVVLDTSGATDKIKYERIYLGGYELYREYDSSENLDLERETHHIMDDQRKIALLEVKTVNNGSSIPNGSRTTIARYQYTNHLDSACLELNDSAEILSYEEYHPFGTTSYSLHTNDSEVSLKRYKYVHKERDDESGLYYYGARYYAPWLCRFVSVDPLKDKYPFYATYQYAGNKPVTFIDLDGLEEAKPSGDTTIQQTPEDEPWLVSAARKISQAQPPNKAYETGLSTGIIMGLWDTLKFVGRASAIGIAIEYFSGNETLPEEIFSGISELSEQLSTEQGREAFYEGMKLFAQEYWEEVSFQEGIFDAGVAHGKLAFDVALSVLGGAGGVKALQKAIQQGPKAVSALLRKSAKGAAKPKKQVDEVAGSEYLDDFATLAIDEVLASKLGGVENFMATQLPRLQKKLGTKIGQGRLNFPASREGVEQAIESVRSTLKNPSEATGVIPSSTVSGNFDLIHVYSKSTGNTVSLRVLGGGKYEFDTLIHGKSSKFRR